MSNDDRERKGPEVSHTLKCIFILQMVVFLSFRTASLQAVSKPRKRVTQILEKMPSQMNYSTDK